MSKTFTITLPGESPVTLTAAGFCAPCEAQTLQAQTYAVQQTYQVNEGAEVPAADVAWEGEIGFEGQFTGDGRYINKGALYFDDSQLPMPLRWAPEDVGAHGGAQVIGLIQTLQVKDGAVKATGIIDTSTELGQRVVSGLQKGTIKGVSMDLDDYEVEMRLKKEVYDEYMAEMAEFEKAMEKGEFPEPEKLKPDENGYVKVGEGAADDEVVYMTSARIRAATLVDIPAFANAYVALVADEAVTAAATSYALVASAPVNPPSGWFENPSLREATPLTFTADGRVFGHIALWGTCHTGFAGVCKTPPMSRTNYALFRTGALHTDDGKEIAVGHMSMDTGHAPLHMSYAPAASHYDDTGTVVADLVAGEDSHGIYVAGALRPGLSDVQMRALRAAPMSGDWRESGGNLELAHILAVNLPGFPVPRTKALVASGRPTSLIRPVESDSVVEEPVKEPTKLDHFNALALELNLRGWDKIVGE